MKFESALTGYLVGTIVTLTIVSLIMITNRPTQLSFEDGSKVICLEKQIIVLYDPDEEIWRVPEEVMLNVCEL